MRFISFIIALGGVASAVSVPRNRNNLDVADGHAFARDIPSTDTVVPQLNARAVEGKTTSNTISSSGKHVCLANEEAPEITPSSLEELTDGPSPNGWWEFAEGQYRLANKMQGDEKLAVVQVSGCSAVFFFNADGMPSVFHIFSGQEEKDGAAAAELVTKMGSAKPTKSIYIAAASKEKYEALCDAMYPRFGKRVKYIEHVYPKPAGDYRDDMRWRFDLELPGQDVQASLYHAPSRDSVLFSGQQFPLHVDTLAK